MLYLIDSSAVLNSPGFSFTAGSFLTTPLIVDELRDLRSRHLAENALKNNLLALHEPSQESMERVTALALEHGFTRLSKADVSLLALALDLKRKRKRFTLVTDDYSVQNFCKLLRIRFESVIRGRIKATVSFRKKCSGCGKEFGFGYSQRHCPECGSMLVSERL